MNPLLHFLICLVVKALARQESSLAPKRLEPLLPMSNTVIKTAITDWTGLASNKEKRCRTQPADEGNELR